MQTKIVFIAHSFERGGAQKYLYDFVRHCCADGIRCLVIGPRSGPQMQDFRDLGVELIPIRLTSIWASSVVLRLWQFIKIFLNTLEIMKVLLKFQPIAVFSNTSMVSSGALASKILRLPHFWHVHENFHTLKPPIAVPHKALQKIMEFMSVKVIFVSHLAMKAIFPNGSPKTVVIQNGVDLSRFKFRNLPSRKAGNPRICFVGSLSYLKGVDILLLALAFLKHENVRVPTLEIWGSGGREYSRLLKNLADELGIADHVRFMGYTSNIDEILPEYDVLVVPSRSESFSLVVAEGMAVGVPVVATRCGGPEEIIDQETNGILVDVGDYEGIARAIRKILYEKAYGESIAKEARCKVVRCFDLNLQLQKISHLILPRNFESRADGGAIAE